MVIPTVFQDILSLDNNWNIKTQTIINKIEIYLNSSELYFFPEYTNHSLTHIKNILYLVEKLIPQKTLYKLSAKDIAILVLGIFSHDIGMFLKPDGLNKLLELNEWKQKFDEFIKIMSRLSDVELKKIYGNNSFAYPRNLTDNLNLSVRDRLTYGEFLRQYHAIISEYIVLNGFPGKRRISVFEELESEYSKIVGLLAKSHCMSLREAAAESNSKLMGKINSYKPSNIPIVYLMVLIRLGDILDMGKDRAPHILFNMQQFNSPISKAEWEWNQSIDFSNFNWDIAKTLYIQSEPKNTQQFVKIKKNLRWFQSELDFSWAGLCDYYGSNYELSIHRIESNIFEQPGFFKEQFLTKEAKIQVTSNLSKLLVDPLYRGEPMFGVREVLQNAMDACNLRSKIEKCRGNLSYEGKIVVEINTDKNVFIIKDNGIGMDEDVIVNYYLTVGANFRNSDYWKKACIDNYEDSIVRVGRFGIGFLATFLLGEKITIKTRHIDDKKGYCFNVTLEDEIIDVTRVSDINIGTEIIIEMKPQLNFWKSSFKRKYEKLNMIKWNEWYHFMYPKVEYWIDGHRKYPNLQFRVPNRYQKDELWKEVKSNNFENVNYKFIDVSDNCSSIDVNLGECDFLSNVILNGFILNENLLFKKIWGLPKESVICSIIDDKNLLQLDLSRKQINYKDDIFDTINIEIWKWQIASLLCCNIPNVRLKKGNKRQKLEAYNFKNDYPDGLLLGKNGFSFWQPYFMRMLNLDKVYVLKNPIVTNKENVSIQSYITDSDIPILIFRNDSFRNQLEKEYEKCKRKCDHIFDLLKLDKVQWNTKAKYMEFISALFFEGEDLWIPYDFLQRREKFPTAFNVLKNYTTNNEWILSSKIYRKNTYTSYRDINKYDIRQLYSFLENGD